MVHIFVVPKQESGGEKTNDMNTDKITVGMEVVRSKGDYVVGRIGTVVAVENLRAQVEWNGNTKTWVSFSALEPTSIPYEIVRIPKKHSKYIRQ